MSAPDLTKSGLYLASGPTAGYDGVTRATYTTAAAKPLPSPLPVPAGWAVESTGKSSVVYREVPPAPPPQKPAVVPPVPPPVVVPVTPVPTPVVVPPAPVVIVVSPTPAPKRTPAPNGVYSVGHTADQVIRDLIIRGQARNIICQNFAGNLLIDNVVSLDAYGTGLYDSQGCYLDNIQGTTTIQNSYIGNSGRPRNLGWVPTPSQYAHNIYFNASGKTGNLIVRGCILSEAANCGVQTRTLAGSEFDGNLILNCGEAIELVMGGAKLTNNVIYGAQFFFDGGGWTGNSAFKLYWLALCRNNLVFARPNQGALVSTEKHPATVNWPQAGLNVGGKWIHDNPPWTPPPGYPNLTEYFDPASSGNAIAAEWPGGVSLGPTKLPGWTVRPACVDYDYRPALKAVEDGGSVADAITRVTADLKALLPAAPPN